MRRIIPLLLFVLLAAGVVSAPSSAALAARGIAAPPPAQDDPGRPHLIAKWEDEGGGSLWHSTRTFAPVGAVVCLVHEPTFDLPGEPLPYPDRIGSDAVVGCDAVIPDGSQQVFEYSASNGSEFSEFANRFTNDVEETVQQFVQLVNADRLPDGAGGAAGRCEQKIRLSNGRGPLPPCTPGGNSLLAGYTLDFIRLTVKDFHFNVSADGHSTEYSIKVMWEFYGHR